jgi:hypothetical protein
MPLVFMTFPPIFKVCLKRLPKIMRYKNTNWFVSYHRQKSLSSKFLTVVLFLKFAKGFYTFIEITKK